MLAARDGNIETVKALVDLGADMNLLNEVKLWNQILTRSFNHLLIQNQQTALTLATYYGHTEIVEILSAAGTHRMSEVEILSVAGTHRMSEVEILSAAGTHRTSEVNLTNTKLITIFVLCIDVSLIYSLIKMLTSVTVLECHYFHIIMKLRYDLHGIMQCVHES